MKHMPILSFQRRAAKQLDPDLVIRAERELHFMRLRRRRLPSRRLSDADWAILLELYVAEAQRRYLSIKQLEDASQVPQTTLLRYLDNLERNGLACRSPSDEDGRVTLVKATHTGIERIASILGEVASAEQSNGSRNSSGER
jgi:DNA-binding MarR family transcriptional regulator